MLDDAFGLQRQYVPPPPKQIISAKKKEASSQVFRAFLKLNTQGLQALANILP